MPLPRFRAHKPPSVKEGIGEVVDEVPFPPPATEGIGCSRSVMKDLLTALSVEVDRLIDENSRLKNEFQSLQTQTAQIGTHSPTDGTESPNGETSPMNGEELAFQISSTVKSGKEGEAARLEAEEQYEALYDLTRAFHVLCKHDRASISVEEIIEMAANQQGLSQDDQFFVVLSPRMMGAIQALNKSLGIFASEPVGKKGAKKPPQLAKKTDEPAKEIALDTFIGIMHRKSDYFKTGEVEILDILSNIKDILVKEDALRKVAKATKMSFADLNKAQMEGAVETSCMEKLVKSMDPVIGLVILVNAACICISTDVEPDSIVWQVLEGMFTVIFITELCIKLKAYGCRGFLCGQDKYWNWFDFLVVIVAAADFTLTVLSVVSGLTNLNFLRLFKFLRLTKLVRVLKLRIFHELTLMVNGILAGFRTLIWAIVFLGFMLAALGVLITQLSQQPSFMPEDICDGMSSTNLRNACQVASAHIKEHQQVLFGNVFRSCFTVFRCITEGCASVDGTPLMLYFYNTWGYVVIFFYMVVVLFVLLGLFNLIMAIFVENTIANAGAVEQKRNEAKHKEYLQIARKLQDVIVMFCIGEEDGKFSDAATVRSVKKVRSTYRWVKGFVTTDNESDSDEEEHRSPLTTSKNLSLTVSHGTFNKMLERSDVQNMLDDLDINVGMRNSLFEILDANNNGTLEVSELVQGLLKLRGPINKGESVAALLAVRSMQKSMKSMQVLGLHQQHIIEAIADRVEIMASGHHPNWYDFQALTANVPRSRLEPHEPSNRRSSAVTRAIDFMKKDATGLQHGEVVSAASSQRHKM